jgi:hypothetical protein
MLHEWIVSNANKPAVDSGISMDAFNNLKNFRASLKL